jgi:hypothetical protein
MAPWIWTNPQSTPFHTQITLLSKSTVIGPNRTATTKPSVLFDTFWDTQAPMTFGSSQEIHEDGFFKERFGQNASRSMTKKRDTDGYKDWKARWKGDDIKALMIRIEEYCQEDKVMQEQATWKQNSLKTFPCRILILPKAAQHGNSLVDSNADDNCTNVSLYRQSDHVVRAMCVPQNIYSMLHSFWKVANQI